MDLNEIMKKFAENMGGQYTQYNSFQSVIIIPVAGRRYQTVVSTIQKNDLYNRELIYLTSKVCIAKPDLDYQKLLEQVGHFNYCRFLIKDEYLQVEAVTTVTNSLLVETVQEMLHEVANLADQYEMKLTGKDIQ